MIGCVIKLINITYDGIIRDHALNLLLFYFETTWYMVCTLAL